MYTHWAYQVLYFTFETCINIYVEQVVQRIWSMDYGIRKTIPLAHVHSSVAGPGGRPDAFSAPSEHGPPALGKTLQSVASGGPEWRDAAAYDTLQSVVHDTHTTLTLTNIISDPISNNSGD